MKKALAVSAACILFILVLCGNMTRFPAAAEDASPLEENGWQYRLIFDGAAVQITGYQGDETDLVVPDTIAGLPVWMVGDEKNPASEWPQDGLTGITVSEGIRILANAFNGCPSLTKVVLPDTLFALRFSFRECPALSEVRLPDGLAELNESLYGVRLTMHPHLWPKFGSAFVGCETVLLPFECSPGDLDADNAVTSTDARLALQLAVDKVSLTADQREAADVDGDGQVTSTDARMILQEAVGKESGFTTDLITAAPLFTVDLSTVTATLTMWREDDFTVSPDPSYKVDTPFPNGKEAGRQLQILANADTFLPSWESTKWEPDYAVTVTWGDAGAQETVRLYFRGGELELAYGEYRMTVRGKAGWWLDQMESLKTE